MENFYVGLINGLTISILLFWLPLFFIIRSVI
jgi:hypothetical protein